MEFLGYLVFGGIWSLELFGVIRSYLELFFVMVLEVAIRRSDDFCS